jgi:hypothetical protein
MIEILEAMTAPDADDQVLLSRRIGPKGLVPSTWIERTLRVCYVDCYGSGREANGTLLDLYPAAPIPNLNGAKALISWDRLVVCELIED